MPNSQNQRTLGVSLSGADLAKVDKHIKASGMSVSRFLHQALMAYLPTLPDPDAEKPKLVRPQPHGQDPGGYLAATEEEQRRLGISREDFAAYDLAGQEMCHHQLLWLRGFGLMGGITPKARYDGDMAYLDWLEQHCKDQGLTKSVLRVQRIRAHLLTLPEPPLNGANHDHDQASPADQAPVQQTGRDQGGTEDPRG